MPLKGDLVTGTLDLLVLKALQLGEAHGWGIMERIRATSGDHSEVTGFRLAAVVAVVVPYAVSRFFPEVPLAAFVTLAFVIAAWTFLAAAG